MISSPVLVLVFSLVTKVPLRETVDFIITVIKNENFIIGIREDLLNGEFDGVVMISPLGPLHFLTSLSHRVLT